MDGALTTGSDATVMVQSDSIAAMPLPPKLDLEPNDEPEALGAAWRVIGRIPTSLPDVELESPSKSNARIVLADSLAATAKGMYSLELKDSTYGSANASIYFNALPPVGIVAIDGKILLNGDIAFLNGDESDFVLLNGSASSSFFGSEVTSHSWELLSKPKGSRRANKEGVPLKPESAVTVAGDIVTPGDYKYKLTIVDELGLSGSSIVTVRALYRPSTPALQDIELYQEVLRHLSAIPRVLNLLLMSGFLMGMSSTTRKSAFSKSPP